MKTKCLPVFFRPKTSFGNIFLRSGVKFTGSPSASQGLNMAATAAGKKVFEVFVSKVPWTIATKEVKEYFGQFGQVKKCLLPFDKETGFHRGFCWIGFTTEEGLQNALQKDPHIIEGAKLQVQKNRKPFSGKKSNKEAEDI
ncbi:SRA stem-loop-interacting RNA-binding protein, mitochondrial isoform X1 [Carassius auratus]|uniref:SRA stem-loop-interacting RNA-binding protein, mitochondrial isoform X1 n=1 Tax=Carassius auratus TaxID=7957 RepID=A0A6P6MUE8_CARAU|nr:SRA stem-loop-interacting RNA-binding protein, mitochondrial-like isoform X1 [Carassius auratus]